MKKSLCKNKKKSKVHLTCMQKVLIKVLEKSVTLSFNENVFGLASGGFIDPLEEFAGLLGTLEVESIQVID